MVANMLDRSMSVRMLNDSIRRARNTARANERKLAAMKKEYDDVFLDTAQRSVARAITDVASGQTEINTRGILEKTLWSEYDLRALSDTLMRACEAGALKALSDGKWLVLDEAILCKVAYDGIE